MTDSVIYSVIYFKGALSGNCPNFLVIVIPNHLRISLVRTNYVNLIEVEIVDAL